ncbi:MAG: hypothetical protein CMM58_02725 [Rhodospirillaceae bacterium]|nr:hypothetical protein [Rhodospirillaceae bacterium]
MKDPRSAIERHHMAINSRNLKNYIDTVVFPFTYQNYNGLAITIEKSDEYGIKYPTPWDIILATDPNWSHTEFDEITELMKGSNSVAYRVVFRRIDSVGSSVEQSHAIWIAVHKFDRWGVQFRHNMGSI